MHYATLDDFVKELPLMAAQHREKLAGHDALFLLETRQGRRVFIQLQAGTITLLDDCGQAPACAIVADENDLLAMIAGKLNPAKAILFGKVKVKGNPKPLMDLVSLLR